MTTGELEREVWPLARFRWPLFVLPLIVLAAHLAQWPIVALDNDLWYHLNAGRYIADTGSLPDTSFFSFLEPPRAFVDYYWLFQSLVYWTWSISGYAGLVALRTGIFVAAVGLCAGFLARGSRRPASFAWLAVVSLFVMIAILPRGLLLRPHLFSYLFIIASLFLLENTDRKPRWLWLLPAISILWCNLHGVEYPVMLLVGLAYAAELFVRRVRRGSSFVPAELLILGPIVLSMLGIFLTPHGTSLLTVPFTPIGDATEYIMELQRIRPADLLRFRMEGLAFPDPGTARNLLVILAAGSVVAAGLLRTIRVSHLLLILGGGFLLAKSSRFNTEFILLSLPMVRNASASLLDRLDRKEPGRRAAALALAATTASLIVVSHRSFSHGFEDSQRFPLSTAGLQEGAAVFLNHVDLRGSVLNAPRDGGYLQWKLYPEYRILTDMQTPFLFSDRDTFMALNVFSDASVFRSLLLAYQPSFFVVPTDVAARFKQLVDGVPRFVPVFFDRNGIVYVDRAAHPSIAERFEIAHLDSTALVTGKDSLPDSDEAWSEIERLLEVHPDGGLVNQLAASYHLATGDPGSAIAYSKAAIRNAPDRLGGYVALGEALFRAGDVEGAGSAYRSALERSEGQDRARIRKKLWKYYIATGRESEAYDALRQAASAYDPTTSHEDLFYLGSTALSLGRTDEARIFLNYALLKAPVEDSDWMERIERQLAVAEGRVPAGITREAGGAP